MGRFIDIMADRRPDDWHEFTPTEDTTAEAERKQWQIAVANRE